MDVEEREVSLFTGASPHELVKLVHDLMLLAAGTV